MNPFSPSMLGNQAPLQVARFGAGYWIGAICSTLAVLSLPLFDRPGHDPDPTWPGIMMLASFMASTLLPAMFAGAILSVVHYCQGRRTCDKNALIGGVLGLLLCTWPFAWMIIGLMLVGLGGR